MKPRTIVIDGTTYHSVEEMPPDIRQKYERAMKSLGDANDNGIPDAFERFNIFADTNRNGAPDILEDIVAGQAAVNSMKIIVDGKQFRGIENLPPEVRARYEEAMRQLDADGNGVPDVVETRSNTNIEASSVSAGGWQDLSHSADGSGYISTSSTAPQKPLALSPTVTPDTTNGWMLVLSALFLVLICAAGVAGAWYFLLR